ncbi:hypothetical protein HPB50_004205 [Hyalomma asiaticum]|uniref:Uncharacterized protein n=1 Tax=Hyalomma asiaticum TaxID=266040 RepID=A0ACB7TCQ8_HYAAI|nr:hypothetical protein HPB50_004205 [Hyalomma asiaticum]
MSRPYQLPRRLAEVVDLKHTLNADDVTVWTHEKRIGEQEGVLQIALDIIHDYATETVLHTAPDKTKFIAIHGGRSTLVKLEEKRSFQLYIGNQAIMRKPAIRILDPPSPDRAIELWRALRLFRQDPAAPPCAKPVIVVMTEAEAAVTHFAGRLGQLEPFDESASDWASYK